MSEVRYDGGLAPPVRVDPARLRRSGSALRLVGQELPPDVERAGWALPVAGGGNSGWRAVGAAVKAARQWDGKLRGLAGQLDELGDAFVAAARAYEVCDARASGRAGAVMPW
jgi:hypothetical protein